MAKLKQTKNWTVSQIDNGKFPVHPKAFGVVCRSIRSVCKRFDVGVSHVYIAIIGEVAVGTMSEPDVPYTGLMYPETYSMVVAGGWDDEEDIPEDEDVFLNSLALFTIYTGIKWAQDVLGQSDVVDEQHLEKVREELMFDILNEDYPE